METTIYGHIGVTGPFFGRGRPAAETGGGQRRSSAGGRYGQAGGNDDH